MEGRYGRKKYDKGVELCNGAMEVEDGMEAMG